MKKIALSLKNKCPAQMIAIIVNVALFLIETPYDFGDWLFKMIEFITCLNVLMTARKWRFSKGTNFLFQQFSKESPLSPDCRK